MNELKAIAVYLSAYLERDCIESALRKNDQKFDARNAGQFLNKNNFDILSVLTIERIVKV
jgi:hypothetical protein